MLSRRTAPNTAPSVLSLAASCFETACAALTSIALAPMLADCSTRHADERLAEAALCAISIALSVQKGVTYWEHISRGLANALSAALRVCKKDHHLAPQLLGAAVRVLQSSQQVADIQCSKRFLEEAAVATGHCTTNGSARSPSVLAATLGSLTDVAQECLSQVLT